MNQKIIIMLIVSLVLISGCVVSEKKYQEIVSEKEILLEEINLLKPLLKETQINLSRYEKNNELKKESLILYYLLNNISEIEGSLKHQSWQMNADPHGIYPEVYKQELLQYNLKKEEVKEQIDKLVNLLNNGLNFEYLPEDIDDTNKLEQLKDYLDASVNHFQALINSYEIWSTNRKPINIFEVEYQVNYSSSAGDRRTKVTYIVDNNVIRSCNGTYTFEGQGEIRTENCDVNKLRNQQGYFMIPELITHYVSNQKTSHYVNDGRMQYAWRINLK